MWTVISTSHLWVSSKLYWWKIFILRYRDFPPLWRTWSCVTWRARPTGGPTLRTTTGRGSEEGPLWTRLCARRTSAVSLDCTSRPSRRDNTTTWRHASSDNLNKFNSILILYLQHALWNLISNPLSLGSFNTFLGKCIVWRLVSILIDKFSQGDYWNVWL